MPATVPAIKMTRTIEAPVERVFQAWVDPELLQKWLAPGPYEVQEVEADARPGGRYRIAVSHGDDGPHTTSGEYLEIEPDRRLVKTWFYQGPNGDDETPSVLTIDFKEVSPGVTELTLTHEKLRDVATSEGVTEGWELCLDNLAGLWRDPTA